MLLARHELREEEKDQESGRQRMGSREAEKIIQDSFWGEGSYASEGSADVHERSRGVHESIHGCSRAVHGVFTGVHGLRNEQVLNIKAAKNAKMDRFSWAKMLGFGILFTCSCVNTMNGGSLRSQICCYLSTAAYFVATDAIGAFDRVLARQARMIIAFVIGLTIAFVMIPRLELLLVILVSGLFGALIIKLLNARWLAAENWLMSAEVQRALLNNPGHLGKDAIASWQATGARETRTILSEVGLSAFDDVLESLKPIFILGYLRGGAKSEEYKKEIRKLEKSAAADANCIEKLEDEVMALRLQVDEAQRNECIAESDSLNWKNLYEKSKKTIAALEETNKELAQLQDSAEEIAEASEKITKLHEKTLNEQILDLHRAGLTYRKIQEQVGCSVGYISKIVKESCKENEKAAG